MKSCGNVGTAYIHRQTGHQKSREGANVCGVTITPGQHDVGSFQTQKKSS